MATTTNINLKVIDGWVTAGGLVDPIVIENGHTYRDLEVCFGDAAVTEPMLGHFVKAGDREWGIVGSQMWIRAASGNITVVITE
jgi:hypothetical protein